MISGADAKYILGEIRNIPYYERRIAEAQARLHEIDLMITETTAPVSPNGGSDVVIHGKAVRVKVHGSGTYDSGRAISELITAQGPIEAELALFSKRCAIAKRYRQQVLDGAETGLVADFMEGRKTYRQMQDEYYVSNVYDKVIRIIIQTVKAV